MSSSIASVRWRFRMKTVTMPSAPLSTAATSRYDTSCATSQS